MKNYNQIRVRKNIQTNRVYGKIVIQYAQQQQQKKRKWKR